jgi:ubiquinone/menaquinone biosynthesis C-methylase UbiE
MVGTQYVNQIKALNYCNCLFIVDKRYQDLKQINGIKVCSPDSLANTDFDKIIIAGADVGIIKEIFQQLVKMAVPIEKIVNKVPIYNQMSFLTRPNPQNETDWDSYYLRAENSAQNQFNLYFEPILSSLSDLNLSEVLDFACGHGRMANLFSKSSKRITCCDVNETAVDFCRERFSKNTNCEFVFKVNETGNNNELKPLPFTDKSYTFIYSWDAMVHFTYRWLDFYLCEFYRILSSQGYLFIHHSNMGEVNAYSDLGENWYEYPGHRTPVSSKDVLFIAQKHNYIIVEQKLFNWTEDVYDCITILKKP